tara:strand:- start:137 stop:358 length:222 start_codon:yes stop_codon:yes gene_type:complete
MRYINDIQINFENEIRINKISKTKVAEVLNMTLPTLNAKLKNPNMINVLNIKALKKLKLINTLKKIYEYSEKE